MPYEDPHELVGEADYLMANPPFNVDEIDADKVKNDPRLPFGLPGVNKEGKVSNGNYVWISYFHSYLNERGRAGFVMSSQASSAGKSEKTVRRKLIETGDVELMIAIRTNFFYTRTVPCELWFLNRDKPETYRDKVLMLDARGVYRRVTRKIYDFSPEQHKNLLAIVWLYRGETERFVDLVSDYQWSVVAEGKACFQHETEDGQTLRPIQTYLDALSAFSDTVRPFLDSLKAEGPHTDPVGRFEQSWEAFTKKVGKLESDVACADHDWPGALDGPTAPAKLTESFRSLAESCRACAKEADSVFEEHESDKYGLKYGDIVMCEGGEPGRSALWKEQRPGMMIQKALHRIRPANGMSNEFLYYSLFYQGRAGLLAPLFTGATIRHLPREQLAKVEVDVPPIATQHRIASILSAYDNLIENNLCRIELLERAARLVYKGGHLD